MYYLVFIETKGKAKEDFIRHLYNNGYNFFEVKNDNEKILVLEDELEYVETIANENGIEIFVENDCR